MAVNFRSVSQLEAVTSLADDDKILVVQDGTAKAIKKSDAKFGGGGTTTVYNVVSSESTQSADNGLIAVQFTGGTSSTYTLQNADGSEVTAQEVYNAFVAGRVFLSKSVSGSSLVATQQGGTSSVNALGSLYGVLSLDLFGNSIDSIVGVIVYSGTSTITIGSTGNK